MSRVQESTKYQAQMRLIQIDLNNCEAAQDLISRIIRGKEIYVPIICEPYRNYGNGV